MKKIICIGNATWDQTFSVSTPQQLATKAYADGFSVNGGGVAATAAVAIADSGEDVDFIGRLGVDMVGTQISNELQDHGVNIEHCLRYEQAQSSIATIILDEERSSKIYVYNDPSMPKDTSSLFNLDLSDTGAIVADLTWPEGVKALFELAKARDIPTFLRVSYFNNSLVELLELADYCVFNHPSLLAMTSDIQHKRSLSKAVKRVGGTAVVTLSQRGCAWLHDGTFNSLPGLQIEVANTTGAGDIFIGILAMQIGQGKPFEQAIGAANQVAALSCEFMGARQLANNEQVQEALGLR